MKAITEFSSFTLTKAISTHKSLTDEGKTPEEIQENLGQTYKLEGEKLGYFVKAIEVASTNLEKLRRVLIARLDIGETVPPKAIMIDEIYYIPQFFVQTTPVEVQKPGQRSARPPQTRSNKTSGPKPSQWGLSPEEKAAKGKKPTAAPKA